MCRAESLSSLMLWSNPRTKVLFDCQKHKATCWRSTDTKRIRPWVDIFLCSDPL